MYKMTINKCNVSNYNDSCVEAVSYQLWLKCVLVLVQSSRN